MTVKHYVNAINMKTGKLEILSISDRLKNKVHEWARLYAEMRRLAYSKQRKLANHRKKQARARTGRRRK